MLDTTFTMLRHSVTAFLVAASWNTTIPLVFSFGLVEDCALYDSIYEIFREHFDIDLSTFTLESDQGSGLGKIIRLHRFMHRFCLRHFVASLMDQAFEIFVHYPIKARNESEFNPLREAYRLHVHNTITKIPVVGLKRAQAEFWKIGLSVVYRDGE
jgi:hypothetical protein